MARYDKGDKALLNRSYNARRCDDPEDPEQVTVTPPMAVVTIAETWTHEIFKTPAASSVEDVRYKLTYQVKQDRKSSDYVPAPDAKERTTIHWGAWTSFEGNKNHKPEINQICRIGTASAKMGGTLPSHLARGNVVKIIDILSVLSERSIAHSKSLRERCQATNDALYIVVKLIPRIDYYCIEKWVSNEVLQPTSQS
ncbi:hypothetical protein AMATHDRAFT_4384 [Amanita thiersii Skay4041]|uniref:Uncharacterized protein n=1 Tax=Amanita thiersii Skay4041 TaxID=703135 RepID=A0A2A9NHA3_9AGAR|nr:hypothetical protein AMATHDRAFT_4384 [Amanita thiersii Skay4041]